MILYYGESRVGPRKLLRRLPRLTAHLHIVLVLAKAFPGLLSVPGAISSGGSSLVCQDAQNEHEYECEYE